MRSYEWSSVKGRLMPHAPQVGAAVDTDVGRRRDGPNDQARASRTRRTLLAFAGEDVEVQLDAIDDVFDLGDQDFDETRHYARTNQ